jgi:Fur family ferric uptake transcriptional regulator
MVPDEADPPPEAVLGSRAPKRLTVVDALIRSGDFTSAQALYLQMLSAGVRVGLSTVYRALTALAEAGRVDVVRDTGGERLFRYRPGEQHRHYLLCRICGLGLTVDAEAVENWAGRLAESSGYAEVQHTLELTGTCPDCRGIGQQDDAT